MVSAPTTWIDELEKRQRELIQRQLQFSAKTTPVMALALVLQEAMTLNQQLVQQNSDLLHALKNERKAKNPDSNGGKVSGETPKTAA